MTAPAPNLTPNRSARVLDRCEAIVLETREGHCSLLSIDGQAVTVPENKAGLYLVQVNDLVMADVMDDGTARLAYIIASSSRRFIPQYNDEGESAQLILPAHINQVKTDVGGSRVAVGHQGVDINAPKVSLASKNQLSLQGRQISTEAQDQCTLKGREIHLN